MVKINTEIVFRKLPDIFAAGSFEGLPAVQVKTRAIRMQEEFPFQRKLCKASAPQTLTLTILVYGDANQLIFFFIPSTCCCRLATIFTSCPTFQFWEVLVLDITYCASHISSTSSELIE